ncbi:hypothetical protein ACOSP7_020121 [Xanthoceras sorbifolium]
MANLFISLSLLFICVLFLSKGVLELEASHHIFARYQTSPKHLHTSPVNQAYRTGYHFQPPKNWINGMYRHNIFFFGPGPAIFPSQQADIKGCCPNLAMPKNLSDPYLTEWIKYQKNRVMAPTSKKKINASSFRDPTTAWLGPDKMWRVLIGSRHWTLSGKPLHSAEGIGMWECSDFFPVKTDGNKGLDSSARGEKVKHVLENNLDETKHDYYTIGTYDVVKDKYFLDKDMIEGDSGLRYDYGKFYASKTFFDSEKQRRFCGVGLMNHQASRMMFKRAIPKNIWLDKSGKQLLQWPINEIEKLRGNQVKWPSKILEGGSMLEVIGVTAGQKCLKKSGTIHNCFAAKKCSPSGVLGPFGFLTFASNTLSEYTAVFFRINKHHNKHKVLMCSDQSRSSLNKHNDNTTYGVFVDLDPAHEQLSVKSLIDRSIVESFGGGGKAVITSRVYPTQAIDNQIKLFVFNNGTSRVKIAHLNTWSMKKAQISLIK